MSLASFIEPDEGIGLYRSLFWEHILILAFYILIHPIFNATFVFILSYIYIDKLNFSSECVNLFMK